MKKEEIISRINEFASRLSNLSSDDKRVKKRILQKLGKLKKELANYDDIQVDKDIEEEETNLPESNNEIPQWTKKQSKLKLKIANSDIAEFAQKKQLKAAQKKFNWCVKKGLTPDVHTYTNLLNAYVRCKEMDGAIRTWNTMVSAGVQPNIVSYTTLIKGYTENNLILSAQSILMDMLSGTAVEGISQPPPLPNTRTLNTYWRGCIRWGSVAPALEIYYAISAEPDLMNSVSLDDTSYEYLISLLCQSFETAKAVDLTLNYLGTYSSVKSNTLNINWIEESSGPTINLSELPVDTPENLRRLFTMATTRIMNIDVILSTATIFLSLSRTFILQQYHEAGKSLLTITESLIQETKSSALRIAMENRRRSEPSDVDPTHPVTKGDNSNSVVLFIQHRSSELSREISTLKSYLHLMDHGTISEYIIKGYSKTLLLYHLQDTKSAMLGDEIWKDQLQLDMLSRLNESFGLKNLFAKTGENKKHVAKVMKIVLASITKSFKSSVTTSGYHLNFPFLYQNGQISKRKGPHMDVDGKKKRRLLDGDQPVGNPPSTQYDQISDDLEVKMEICSGNGEWIIEQAIEYQRLAQKRSLKPVLWIAVEIRADRVYQSLYHSILRKATDHVTFLGGDASLILPQLIAENSLSTVFINHPEPPERTSGGEERSQGAHLLTEDFFHDLHRALKPNGKLTIVTDNRLYAHSLARTVDNINSVKLFWRDTDETQSETLQKPVLKQGATESDSESDDSDEVVHTKISSNVFSPVSSIRVQSGEPGERGDHLETDEGSSYFSRMWKNGNKCRVWNLVLIKCC